MTEPRELDAHPVFETDRVYVRALPLGLWPLDHTLPTPTTTATTRRSEEGQGCTWHTHEADDCAVGYTGQFWPPLTSPRAFLSSCSIR